MHGCTYVHRERGSEASTARMHTWQSFLARPQCAKWHCCSAWAALAAAAVPQQRAPLLEQPLRLAFARSQTPRRCVRCSVTYTVVYAYAVYCAYIAGGPRAGRAVKEALTVHGALDCAADRRCCKGSALRSLHWGVLEPCLFARHCIDGDHTGGLGGLHSLCVAPLRFRFSIRKAILGTNQLAPATIGPLATATARCCRFSPLRLPLAAHVAVLDTLGQPAPAVRFLHAPHEGGN
jgi:hypothetical protein